MTYIISYRSRIAKKTYHRKINLACDKNIIETYCVNSTIPQLLEHMKYIYKSQQTPYGNFTYSETNILLGYVYAKV